MAHAHIETDDVQGIVVEGYAKLRAAAFMLLAIEDGQRAAAWLDMLLREGITTAADADGDVRVNVAFTHAGITKLGVAVVDGFSAEYAEDVWGGTGHRSRVLGDHGACDPRAWQWGGPCQPRVDILLMLYASSDAERARLSARQRARFPTGGLLEIATISTTDLPARKEHFGFHDGIGNPRIWNGNMVRKGILDVDGTAPENSIQPGELLLGYPNEDGKLPPSPTVDRGDDPRRILLPSAEGRSDLGRNGTYVVMRQLEQDVRGFWKFVSDAATPDMPRLLLAAKMVGRWPNGAPLTTTPEQPDLAKLVRDDAFLYRRDGDERGLGCPLGAHMRRANPRDTLGATPAESLAIARKHRILRRSRPYGEPLHVSMDPEAMLSADGADTGRGVLFLCLNADIRGQFEFIQQNWVNSRSFADLSEQDPLVANRDASDTGAMFSVQRDPVRHVVDGLCRYVTLRGAGYFFLPGLRALRYLASR